MIRRYVEGVPGGRPHIPVDRHEPVHAFETIASNYPVFRVVPPQSFIPVSDRRRYASRMPIRF